VGVLNSNAAAIGLGEIYDELTLALNYNVGGWEQGQDPRSPGSIVTPNVGVTYSSSTSMIGDHGGFARDDPNVMLRVANPGLTAQTVSAPTATVQVAPTIVEALGLNPTALEAVKPKAQPCCPKLWRSSESSRWTRLGGCVAYLIKDVTRTYHSLRRWIARGQPGYPPLPSWRLPMADQELSVSGRRIG
jgi:hypothetical protein